MFAPVTYIGDGGEHYMSPPAFSVCLLSPFSEYLIKRMLPKVY